MQIETGDSFTHHILCSLQSEPVLMYLSVFFYKGFLTKFSFIYDLFWKSKQGRHNLRSKDLLEFISQLLSIELKKAFSL